MELDLDKTLELKLKKHAKDNNITTATLIETILFDYIDDLEAKKGPIYVQDQFDLEMQSYNPGDIAYLEKAFGMAKKEDE